MHLEIAIRLFFWHVIKMEQDFCHLLLGQGQGISVLERTVRYMVDMLDFGTFTCRHGKSVITEGTAFS